MVAGPNQVKRKTGTAGGADNAAVGVEREDPGVGARGGEGRERGQGGGGEGPSGGGGGDGGVVCVGGVGGESCH